MGKRKILFQRVLPAAALAGAVFTSLALYKVLARPEGFLTTSSPGGNYRVELTGQPSRPLLPGVNNKVRFNVWKNNAGAFLSDQSLYSGDWFDASFATLYPRHTWVNDHVLKFHGRDSPGITHDVLVIENKAGQKVDYLKVSADCLLLLFDLPAGYSAQLAVPPSRGSLKWLSAEGQYASGQAAAKNAADFLIPKESKGPFTFHVVIGDDGFKVESSQLEKYKAP